MNVERPGDAGTQSPRDRETGSGSRRITFVVFPNLQVLDLTGPHEVFSMANRILARRAQARSDRSPEGAADATGASGALGTTATDAPSASGAEPPYVTEVVASRVDDRHGVRTSSGLHIAVDRPIGPDAGGPTPGAIDTLVVVGGLGAHDAAFDDGLVEWVRTVAPSCRRITSVCTGAFILAAAGLLDGRRATTHWESCDRLQERFPAVEVEDDPIFVRDGDVVTSAGVTAGIDLALALVDEDLGSDVALEVARALVVFVRRQGGQSQFSAQLTSQSAERRPLRDLQAWIVDHPDADLSVAALAERVAMSPRHLARVFRDEVGVTPAHYVETVRIEAVRRLLETTDRSLHQIARQTGFGTVDTLLRAFRRRVHTSPGEYRRRFTPQRSMT